MKRSHEGFVLDSCDLLGSQELRKSHLVSSNGDLVPLDTLRGKIVALYFVDLNKQQYPSVHTTWIINFYNILMQNHRPNFDMVFVAATPPSLTSLMVQDDDSVYDDDDDYDKLLPVFTEFTSTLPFPSVPFQDRDWRSHLCDTFYQPDICFYWRRGGSIPGIQMTIIDTCNNQQLLYPQAMSSTLLYGPAIYPFTEDRLRQVIAQFDDFGKGDIKSLQDLLGSHSRDYLLDSHSNMVPISELKAYDSVGIYAYTRHSVNIALFREHLHRIYTNFNSGGNKCFEIVFIDLMADSSYSEEDKKMPWLTVPYGDEKTWILANMFTSDPFLGRDQGRTTTWDDEEYAPEHPLLFIKPKGEACLERYGYHMIEYFGEDVYPFTERALARHTIDKLQRWTLDSFVKQAGQAGLDLNRFVRHKIEKGEKEEVTLSSLRESSRGIIFMFAACTFEGSKMALDRLTKAYKKQDESPFEVIFANAYLKETQTDIDHLSNIPWLALEEQPDMSVWDDLTEKTGKLLHFYSAPFVTFAPDGTLLGAGLLECFENCDFPLISEDELMKHVGLCLLLNHVWWMNDADSFRWLGLPREAISEDSDESDCGQ